MNNQIQKGKERLKNLIDNLKPSQFYSFIQEYEQILNKKGMEIKKQLNKDQGKIIASCSLGRQTSSSSDLDEEKALFSAMKKLTFSIIQNSANIDIFIICFKRKNKLKEKNNFSHLNTSLNQEEKLKELKNKIKFMEFQLQRKRAQNKRLKLQYSKKTQELPKHCHGLSILSSNSINKLLPLETNQKKRQMKFQRNYTEITYISSICSPNSQNSSQYL